MTLNLTEIYLVRHGETQSNAEKRIQGQSNSPLTRRGQQQVQSLSQKLKNQHFATLYSSDLGRAIETAEILGENLSLPVQLEPNLREVCFGDMEGLSWDEVKTLQPQLSLDWYHHQANVKMPGGECRESVTDRVIATLLKWVDEHPGEKLLAVTHGGVLACILSHILQIPKGIRPQCMIENTGLSILQYSDSEWKIKTWNDLSHLMV